ncbi:MAG: MFS transporter [Pseudomonadota bacterium]
MVAIIFGVTLAVLDGNIVNLALPGIARDLHASAAHAVWVINAYQVAILTMLLPCAMLGDLVGYKKVYLWGAVLFTIASLGCVMADSLGTLALARAAQGVGAAALMGVNAALVRLTYPRALLGRGIAINAVVVATSAVAGPPIAAAILSVASWPWLFAFNLPLGVLVLLIGRRSLPVNVLPPAAGARLHWIDVVLNALMFTLVVLGADALGVGAGSGAGSGASGDVLRGLAMLAAGIAIGIFYVRRQLALAVPLFPVDLLRIPVFRLSMCSSVGTFAAQMMAFISLPFLLLDAYGRSPAQTGLILTAWPLGVVTIAPIAGWLIGRFPDGLLGGIGLAMLSSGLALLAALPAHPSNADIVWRLALCGLGFGLFQSPNNHTIVTSAPPHRSGGASGMLGTARLTGQTLGAVLLATIFSFSDAHNGRGPVVALVLGACFAALAAVTSSLRVKHA